MTHPPGDSGPWGGVSGSGGGVAPAEWGGFADLLRSADPRDWPGPRRAWRGLQTLFVSMTDSSSSRVSFPGRFLCSSRAFCLSGPGIRLSVGPEDPGPPCISCSSFSGWGVERMGDSPGVRRQCGGAVFPAAQRPELDPGVGVGAELEPDISCWLCRSRVIRLGLP